MIDKARTARKTLFYIFLFFFAMKSQLRSISFLLLLMFVCFKFAISLSTGLGNYFSTDYNIFFFDISSLSLLGFFSIVFAFVFIDSKKTIDFRAIKLPVIFFFMTLLVLSTSSEQNFHFRYILIFSTSLLTALSLDSISQKIDYQKAFLILAILLSLMALKQYYWDFQRDADALREAGQSFIAGKLEEKLIFGPFSYSNQFASFLILIFPLALTSFSKTQQVLLIKQKLLLAFLVFLFTYALYLTKSKTAFFSLLSVSSFFIIFYKITGHKKRLFVSFSFLIIASLMFWQLYEMKKLGTLITRYYYYQAAIEQFLQNPFIPSGIGSFFPNYMKLKPAGIEDTRFPHSIFFFLISQFAIWGLIFYLLIIRVFWQKAKSLKEKDYALFFALMAWFIHAHFDYLLYSPASLVVIFFICLKLFKKEEQENLTQSLNLNKILCFSILIIFSFVSIYQFWTEQRVAQALEETPQELQTNSFSLENKYNYLKNIQIIEDPDLIDFFANLAFSHYQYYRDTQSKLKAEEFINLSEKLYLQGLSHTQVKYTYYQGLAKIALEKQSFTQAEQNVQKSLHYYPFSKISLNLESQILKKLNNYEDDFMLNKVKKELIKFNEIAFRYHFQKSSISEKGIKRKHQKLTSLINDIKEKQVKENLLNQVLFP